MALSLLLLILLAAADGFRISNLLQKQSDNILVVQWPPNVCQVEEWSSPACDHNYWTIHGWWPPKSDTKNEDDFSVTEIEDLVDNMEQVWPQLSGKNNTRFWKHEWDEHGKPGGLTVHEYFTKALDYFDKVLGNCTEPSKEIKNCLIEKGEVKEYRLIKRAREGETMIEDCTVNDNGSQCKSVMKTKGNSDISFRRGRRGRHRSRSRKKSRSVRRGRRGRSRSRRKSKSRSVRRGRRGRSRSRRKSKSRSGQRSRRRRNRSRRKSKSRSRRKSKSRSRSRSNEHNSRSHQSNNQNEYYVVEARLVLPANFI
ncbi:serine/arginine-rich splicing factor 6-like isoform X5 [Hypanus sabinus]|uniref:serine/arginine-rich splicing factor 6-like isoform X4 n=1 Tax=Hypanus sabinus TaxID=79690 RepID=UPI0028C4C78D|nr:serine/arginine-rich splicing factor 6-like isoform X4 [Hypanus sabinus]XP_059830048.1 serine/arginine-rich splicing factor 6-like isoform X5 [Hypanus sabinus]